MKTEPFEFVADGNVLRGVIDLPAGRAPRAVLLFVHGYGRTDVVAQNWYYDLRSRFTDLGLATVVWDKPGCGKSEGTFDIGQPVASSAREVAAAVRQIREKTLPGVTKIGLWGLSRAGWIAPLAMAQEPGIGFWISVSGTDDQENFPYFIESNFRIEGRSEAQIRQLMGEWRRGFELTARGGTFEAYLDATKTLRHDPFMLLLTGSPDRSKAEFLEEQRRFASGAFTVDDRNRADDLRARLPGPARPAGHARARPLRREGQERGLAQDARSLHGDDRPKPQGAPDRQDLSGRQPQPPPVRDRRIPGDARAPEEPPMKMSDGYYETILAWLRTEVLDEVRRTGARPGPSAKP